MQLFFQLNFRRLPGQVLGQKNQNNLSRRRELSERHLQTGYLWLGFEHAMVHVSAQSDISSL